jgi:hypothetical protein
MTIRSKHSKYNWTPEFAAMLAATVEREREKARRQQAAAALLTKKRFW